MSRPSRRMRPSVGARIPAMTLARVDLPPPLGPVMTTKRPSSTVRLTSLRISLLAPSSTCREMCCNCSIFFLRIFHKTILNGISIPHFPVFAAVKYQFGKHFVGRRLKRGKRGPGRGKAALLRALVRSLRPFCRRGGRRGLPKRINRTALLIPPNRDKKPGICEGRTLKSPGKTSKTNGLTKQKGVYYAIFERTLNGMVALKYRQLFDGSFQRQKMLPPVLYEVGSRTLHQYSCAIEEHNRLMDGGRLFCKYNSHVSQF